MGARAQSTANDSKNLRGVDPKTKIEISNLLHDAMFDVEDARYQEAVPLLERVLKEQPEMPVANMQYGMAEARLRNYDKAIAPLQNARPYSQSLSCQSFARKNSVITGQSDGRIE